MSANNYWTADGWPGWSADGWSEWSADGWFGYDLHIPAVDVVVLETASPTFATDPGSPPGSVFHTGVPYYAPLLPPPSAVPISPTAPSFAVADSTVTQTPVKADAPFFVLPPPPGFT